MINAPWLFIYLLLSIGPATALVLWGYEQIVVSRYNNVASRIIYALACILSLAFYWPLFTTGFVLRYRRGFVDWLMCIESDKDEV